MTDARPALRDRVREGVRGEIAAAALDLFSEQGFEHTTVEQIATRAGISRRSFHRYFTGKEDVLGRWFADIGERTAAALETRPAEEAPWTALRRSFDGIAHDMTRAPEARTIAAMMFEVPALHGSHLQKVAAWRGLLAAALLHRDAGADPSSAAVLRATALAGAALAALEAAQVSWASDDSGPELAVLVDRAMGAISPLG